MKKKAEIIIYGMVQKAGYKDFIEEIAFNLDINGNVKNLDNGTVRIVCEGEDIDIKKLIEKINIKQYPIRVDQIDVEYMEIMGDGEFKIFEIIREENLTLAVYDRMDSVARYVREMNQNLGGKVDHLGDKIDNLGGKVDHLGDKIDNLGGKVDHLGISLGDKIDNLGDKIDTFRNETNDNFARMDSKYELISKGMFAIVDKIEDRNKAFETRMEKTEKNIERLLEILEKKK